MNLNLQQRTCIKFCVKNGFNGARTLEMLEKCFGNNSLKKTVVYQWHERFKSGRESIEDDERNGRPSTSKTDENIDKVTKMLVNNRKLTIREIAEDLNSAYGSVQDILVNDLGFRRVAARLVPKDLNFMQKRDRVDVAKEMICEAKSDPTFIKRIITGDETWVYEYDTQSRHQASEWRSPNEPRPKKPRRFQSKKKAMLTVFIDYNGVVHHEFLPEGQTVNKEYYLGVMRRLREAIRRKRPELWAENSWILHHDNAPSHNAIIIRNFLTKNATNTIQQPPNSPDLAPCDFFLFNRVKKPLRGTRFSSREEVMEKSQEALMGIPKTEYKKCFEDWIKRWHKCVAVDGDYFEGDNIDLDE